MRYVLRQSDIHAFQHFNRAAAEKRAQDSTAQQRRARAAGGRV